jgi:agmatinase
MVAPLTVPPGGERQTFLDVPLHTDLETLDAHVAILGVPHGMPYGTAGEGNDQGNAPTAVRAASDLISEPLDHWDFDLGGPLLDGRDVRIADCGDVAGGPGDAAGHYARAEAAVRTILSRGAVPLVIGGDHGVPIPVFRAYEGRGPITLVQIDAHLDWRDEVGGEREGYSSPIRRASEMGWIGDIFQIGLRGVGSARAQEVAATRDYGCEIVTAYEVHEAGMDAVLARIPAGGDYYLTIDADGLDPSVMPAVAAPAPGGLTFDQARTLIHGLEERGRVVGMDVVEITPSRDVNQISAVAAGRLMANLIGAMARAGRFDGR